MSKSNISVGIMAACMLALFPYASEAYFTTDQSATQIAPNAALFTIAYAFGLEDYDIYMPIIAERNLTRESDEKKVGYVFSDNNTIQEGGTSAALVLSTAPVVNGMYKIAKGTAETMTLFAILVADESITEEDFALQVTKLPYYVDDKDGTLEALQLNVSELQYYQTEEVELNTRTE